MPTLCPSPAALLVVLPVVLLVLLLCPAALSCCLPCCPPLQVDDETGGVQGLTMGRIASFYYMKHQTMATFAQQLRPGMDVRVRSFLQWLYGCQPGQPGPPVATWLFGKGFLTIPATSSPSLFPQTWRPTAPATGPCPFAVPAAGAVRCRRVWRAASAPQRRQAECGAVAASAVGRGHAHGRWAWAPGSCYWHTPHCMGATPPCVLQVYLKFGC